MTADVDTGSLVTVEDKCLNDFIWDTDVTCMIDEIMDGNGSTNTWKVTMDKLIRNKLFKDEAMMLSRIDDTDMYSGNTTKLNNNLFELKRSVLEKAIRKFNACSNTVFR